MTVQRPVCGTTDELFGGRSEWHEFALGVPSKPFPCGQAGYCDPWETKGWCWLVCRQPSSRLCLKWENVVAKKAPPRHLSSDLAVGRVAIKRYVSGRVNPGPLRPHGDDWWGPQLVGGNEWIDQ